MMRFLLLLICLVSININAQDINVLIGLGQNQYFDIHEDTPHYDSSYESGLLKNIRIGLSDVQYEDLKFSILLGVRSYESSLFVRSGGLGGGSTLDVDVKKTLLTLGFYPVKRSLFDELNVEFGIVYSRLINEVYKGESTDWVYGQGSSEVELDGNEAFSEKVFFCLGIQAYYSIPLSKNLNFLVQLSSSFNLSDEFERRLESTRAYSYVLVAGLNIPLTK